jgi:hypothetical protein
MIAGNDRFWRPGTVLNDKAQNVRVVYVGEASRTFGENDAAARNQRNKHYASDPEEALCQVVYLPDEGEMKAPKSVYEIPESRLERVKVEEAIDMGANPLDELQADTIASTLMALGITDIEKTDIDPIAGEEIASMVWETLEAVAESAQGE